MENVLCAFVAKFTNDVCPKCGEDIVAGEPVKWTDTHRNKLMHDSCEPVAKSPIPPEVENELYDTFIRCQNYYDQTREYDHDLERYKG